MKKIIICLLLVCCILCLSAGLVACKDNYPDNENNQSEVPPSPPTNETETPVEKVTYTVMVICADPDVLAAVKVKLVNASGEDVTEAKAPQNGIVKLEAPAGRYSVKTVDLPSTYAEPSASVSATTLSATLNLTLKGQETSSGKITYKITVLKPDGTPVADLPLQICSSGAGSACYPGKTNSEGVASVTVVPDSYAVHIADDDIAKILSDSYVFDDEKYTVTATVTELTVYLQYAQSGDEPEGGDSLYNRISVDAGTHTLTFTEKNSDFFLEFHHNGIPGKYRLSANDVPNSAFVKYYAATISYVNPYPQKQTTATDNRLVLEFDISKNYLDEGNVFVFEIGLSVPENCVLQYKIEKIADLNEVDPEHVTVIAEALDKATYAAEIGKSVRYLTNKDEIEYDPETGVWKLTNGKTVLVTVSGTKYYPRPSDKNFLGAYIEAGGVGFSFGTEETIYDYAEFIVAYDAIGNADGLCALTTELKEFLEGYARINGLYSYDELGSLSMDKLFYFACCYYDDAE